MVAHTKPQKGKKEQSEKPRGETDQIKFIDLIRLNLRCYYYYHYFHFSYYRSYLTNDSRAVWCYATLPV